MAVSALPSRPESLGLTVGARVRLVVQFEVGQRILVPWYARPLRRSSLQCRHVSRRAVCAQD